jgi:hypothetical protein
VTPTQLQSGEVVDQLFANMLSGTWVIQALRARRTD